MTSRRVLKGGVDHEPNEVQPALLSNGSVLLNARDVGHHGYRLFARSDDRGSSFVGTHASGWVDKTLIDQPSTEGSMIRLGGCLFFTNLGELAADRALNDPCK